METFKTDWVNRMMKTLLATNPNLPKDKIMKYLSDKYDKMLHDKNLRIHNDYNDDMMIDTTVTKLYDFTKAKRPVLGGTGTLFYNQTKVTSPIADIIKDKRESRKYHQRKRDTYPRNSYEYMYEEMMQMEDKVKNNSIYGSFGTPTFQLYNRYVAEAITGTAQSLISVTAMGFESIMTNSVPFKSLDECLNFIVDIIDKCSDNHEFKECSYIKIKPITDIELVFDKLKSTFRKYDKSYDKFIYKILKNVNTSVLTHLYYTNNIYKFMENEDIIKLVTTIFDNCAEFKNPNDVPESISDYLGILWDYINEYVYYNYSYTEPINRLKNDQRSTAKLIDTDSNLINAHPFVLFLKDNVWDKTDSTMDDDNKKFASVNILAFLITKMLRVLLDRHCESSNVLDQYKPVINMKNEFYFDKLLLARVKKRYVASIRLREGKLLDPYKAEIKGHDFKKASISEATEKAFINIIKERIFESEDIDIPGICADLDRFEKSIRESIDRGERTFMLRMNCKEPEHYANPYSEGAVTSVLVWNTIYPDREIQLPDKLDVILVSIPDEKCLECIKDKFPREYDVIKNTILNGDIEQFRTKGIKYLAIPNDYERIPEFIKPFINYDLIISRNISTFLPIKDALGMPGIKGKDKKTYFSNIIDM